MVVPGSCPNVGTSPGLPKRLASSILSYLYVAVTWREGPRFIASGQARTQGCWQFGFLPSCPEKELFQRQSRRGSVCFRTPRVSSCDSVLDADAQGYIQHSLSKGKCQREAFRPIHWLSAVGIAGGGGCHGQVDLEKGCLRLVDTEILPLDTHIAPVMPPRVDRMRCAAGCERALMSEKCGDESRGSLASPQRPLAVGPSPLLLLSPPSQSHAAERAFDNDKERVPRGP